MESCEERGGEGEGGGELLRGSRYPQPRSGTLGSRAPAGLFNPPTVSLNRGSAAGGARRKREREEQRVEGREGRTGRDGTGRPGTQGIG